MTEEFFILHAGQKNWPALLNQLPDPPQTIYGRGNPAALTGRALAVVGSRRMTTYGEHVLKEMIPLLTPHFTIVSGLALGVDGAAHSATLVAAGQTVAVLGSGADDASLYPAAHLSLAKNIVQSGGCLISEYPPGTKAWAHHFPVRNRLIAGLAVGVLIIEAAIDSGTMITARLALDYNREVLAVPGSIFAPTSYGTNALLKIGAKPVANINDILECFNLAPIKTTAPPSLPPEQLSVFSLLSSEPIPLDEISRRLHWDARQTAAVLVHLELTGHVKKIPGQGFIV